jgi:hypothetical protein
VPEPETPQPKAAEQAAFSTPALGVAPVAVPAPGPGRALRAGEVLALQRASGNQAVNRVLDQRAVARAVRKLASVRSTAVRLIQRSNPADTRLPLNQPEAIGHASAAKADILAALASLSASPDLSKKNIPDLVASAGLKLAPLTPRHDTPVGAAALKFFTGSTAYAGTFTSADTLTYHVGSPRTNVFIRARDHVNVDTMLPAATIAERIVQALSEVSQTLAGAPGPPGTFQTYRGKFNGYWDVAPFSGQATEFKDALDSRGPRTERARNIFERIESEDAAFKAAYDANAGGIKERVDSMTGPDALNALNSPRVQALRAKFYAHPKPVVTLAQYNALKADVTAGVAGLKAEDQEAISKSNQWRELIVDQATTPARRDELLAIITNVPAAAAPPPPPIPPPPAPVAAGPAQAFLNSVTIDAPAAPVPASARTETVILTPRSPAPNPGVVVDTRFTVTPAARVVPPNVSPASPFPAGAAAGTPFGAEVRNTGNIVMQAELELINNPAGLVPAGPIKKNFAVNDDRRASFIANWSTGLNFTKQGNFVFFNPAMPPVVNYIGGSQEFIMWTELKGGATNPGLSFFSKVGVHRGGAKLAESIDAFPQDQGQSPEFRPVVAAPVPAPIGADPLEVKYDLLDTDRATVLKNKVVPVPVMPEAVYAQAAAEAAATADDAWMHDPSPAGLLGQLTAKGGPSAKLAAAIAPPNPIVELKPITIRHDSAAYVTAAMGMAGNAAWFEGTMYGAFPDPNTRLDSPARPAYALKNRLFLNRTTDVATGAKRPDAEIVIDAIHEGTHAVDEWDVRTPAEDYRSEFRAYWNEGRFGPPNVQICPVGAVDCFDSTIDDTMPAPGPKSPRAREIFKHLYNSYDYVRTAYDNDTSGFRAMVDNYTHPEGLNLNFSRGLDALQGELRKYTAATFPALFTTVKGFMGIGPPPPAGVLSADEQTEVASQRSWDLLINRVVTVAAHRTSLKTTLKIP